MITIIVLLILAGVTIVTLTGDNGLITKAGEAKEKNEESEICEQIKLAYLDYQMAKFKNNNLDGKEYLKTALEKIYGENSINEVKEKNGKYTIKMQDDSICKHNANTGETYKYIDIIDYKGKTRTTLAPGDDINIGTEKFRVFSKTDTEIKAMAFYNLVTITADGTVKQGPVVEGESTRIVSSFSSENYWTPGIDEIDMSDSRNNIQKYITSYETTLKNMGMLDIEVRIARYSELSANGVTDGKRRPGLDYNAHYWLGSSISDTANNVWSVTWNGVLYTYLTYGSSNVGVQPIIIMPIE